jgi:NAD(P)H dehydrogenase (quinone)
MSASSESGREATRAGGVRRIAVTGASGTMGRQVAELLLERVDPSDLVLITRSPEALADLAQRGAEVRRGDFEDAASLPDAFAGVERALVISTDVIGERVDGHKAAIAAARKAGVRHVAYTSIPRPEGNPAAAAPDHAATEEALRESGLRWTFLRNNLYSEFLVPSIAQAIASGQLVTSVGDGRIARVSREDCAAAAAAVLATDGHEDKAYDITGPEALSAQDLAALAGELGGRTVEVVPVDDEALVAGMTAGGLPEPVARILVSFETATREGWLEHPSSAVEGLTGRPPQSLRDVLAAHREELAPA